MTLGSGDLGLWVSMSPEGEELGLHGEGSRQAGPGSRGSGQRGTQVAQEAYRPETSARKALRTEAEARADVQGLLPEAEGRVVIKKTQTGQYDTLRIWFRYLGLIAKMSVHTHVFPNAF